MTGSPGGEGNRAPPAAAGKLLDWALPADERRAIEGDLLEFYRRECRVRGRVRADRWYWREALTFSTAFLWERALESMNRGPARVPAAEEWPAWGPEAPDTGRHTGRKAERMFDGLGRDLLQATRSLRRAPGFTSITVLTLALAIGANTAIFSVIDTVLLDPLDFPEPERLVAIAASAPGSDMPDEFGVGTEFYVHYKENASTLEDLAFHGGGQTTVRYEDNVERLFVSAAPPSLFSTLRAEPLLGRLPTEDHAEGEVVVISHWLWQEWFGGDREVLGRTIEVSDEPRTIIGVMGPEFRFPNDEISLWAHDMVSGEPQPGGFGLALVGRLAPGADMEGLTQELGTLARQLPERFGGPPQYAELIAQHRPVVRSLEAQLVGDIETPLWILLGTVGIVLLIACANVANLLFARAEGRRLDVAVRRAMGAGRARLIRVQLAEAVLLAALGGALGVLLAYAGVPLLVRAAPESIPRLSSVGLNADALLFTAGVVFLAALVSGLLPALRFSQPDMAGGLRDSNRVVSGADNLTRNALVVVQTAAAMVLLVGSGLLLKSFLELRQVDPGYETADIFTFQAAPDPRTHGLVDAPALAQFHYGLMEKLAALPGVTSVGLVNTLPLDEGAGMEEFVTDANSTSPQRLRFTMVGGAYFETMGIDLLAGRRFEQRTQPAPDPGVIVSQRAAEILWPGQDPIGKQVGRDGDPAGMMTVIGVVEDIFLSDFRQEAADPMVYLPMVGRAPMDWGVGTPAYVVKTPRAEEIGAEVRAVVREVAADAPMYRVFTMRQLAARTEARLSFTMLTLAVAATLALVLGAVGLYGVLSYVVSRRRRELGLRMALGAQAGQLRRMVVAQGGRVALLGVIIGLVGAFAATRVLDTLLFGVGSADPWIFLLMATVMLAVAALASYIPARRASSVDPLTSLRSD